MLATTTEIISQSYKFWHLNLRKLLPYLLLMIVPGLLFSIFYLIILMIDYASNVGYYLPSALPFIMFFLMAVNAVFGVWVSIAMIRAVKMIFNNDPGATDWKTIFVSSASYIWPSIYTGIFTVIPVIIGMIFLIIPGIIFLNWLMFSYFLVIFENRFGLSALSGSKAMVSGRWWAIFARSILPMIVFLAAIAVVTGAITWPLGVLLGDHFFISYLLQNLVSTFINVLTAPLLATAMYILYASAKANPVNDITLPPTI